MRKKILTTLLLVSIAICNITTNVHAETSVCTVTADATAGSYKKELETTPEVPNFSWEDNVTSLIPIMATREDIEAVEVNNKTFTAKIEIEKTEYETVKRANPDIRDIEKDYKYCVSMDIKLKKIISDNSEEGIIRQESLHELNDKITLSFEAPSEFNPKKQKLKCTLLRIHEGTLTTLDLKYNEANNTLLFKTDRFSDYIFYYSITDNAKTTPKEEPVIITKPVEPPTTVITENSNTQETFDEEESETVLYKKPLIKKDKGTSEVVGQKNEQDEPDGQDKPEIKEEESIYVAIKDVPASSNKVIPDEIDSKDEGCKCKWCIFCTFLCNKKETCKCTLIVIILILLAAISIRVIFDVKSKEEDKE